MITQAKLAECLDQIDWYRRCLEDVADRRPVRGLDEAKAGYDVAMHRLRQLDTREQ